MQLHFNEWETGADFKLIPETPQEVAALLRLTTNAKAIPAEIRVEFRDQDPYGYIYFEKVERTVQANSLSAKHNSRIKAK